MGIFATINLADGRKMTAELFDGDAPISVANFVKLAKDGFYNGLIFHRVIKGFMIQGGGMTPTLENKDGAKTIKGEFKQNGVDNKIKHTKGVLSMARTMVKDSATSQFFICVDNTPHLDGAYAGFGKLIDEDSIKVAVDISLMQTTRVSYYDDVPATPIVISSITIEEK